MSIRCVFLEKKDTGWYSPPTGLITSLSLAPVGAMWYADWIQEAYWPPVGEGQSLVAWRGPDGHTLVVRVRPNFDWSPDRRASNCTRLDDDKHKCWVRHGEPPNITVDKDGDTCSAGAGSIVAPDWHGFLRNGVLEP